MSRTTRHLVLALSAVLLIASGAGVIGLGARVQSQGAPPPGVDPAILALFKWRSVGPDRGGRSLAVAGVKGQPKVGYMGTTGGGLWKTTDGGENWEPITDGQVHSGSVGAVAVSETSTDVIYLGMGETCIRGNIQPGDGVYKSTDAGKTWTKIGFQNSQAIAKIRIHPSNPDVVFVASFGKYGVPSDERGIYKSTDGGKTWRRVLFHDNKTGGVDIWIDHNHPDVIFAALWEAYRTEYQMSSGGPGSGLYKSTDGGEHWTELTHNPGMPTGLIGKIGVTVSGADSNRVYAIVENENGGVFRSDDAGATWTKTYDGRNLRQRAFYYTHITADPHNADLVYAQDVGTFKSSDGGKTFTNYAGSDSHDFWIDPDDSNHAMYGNDNGAQVTYTALTQPTWTATDYPSGQFYHVVATAHLPYHICGAQQDRSTICIPSTTNLAAGRGGGGGAGGRGGGGGAGGRGGAPAAPATYGPGGAEPGYIAPDPKDPDIFYAGSNNGGFMDRLNRRTGETREVHPYPRMFSGEPSSALVERVQWTYPIIFSPVDPNVLYTATQHLWKTTTAGQTWDKISPDLSRHDPKTMGDSGGPITRDMNGPEVYGTIFAIGPGKRNVNVIWSGSDDGLVQVTQNGGKSWSNVTSKDMPDFGRVSIVDASAFDDASAYVAIKRPLLDDEAPYIFRTHDFGKTWTKIVNGIPAKDYVHTVREDPTRKGLLYAGTQHGVYYSYDDGDTWRSLSLNLPDTQISDLVVAGSDLAIATHGRGFYILDNIAPIRQYGVDMVTALDVYLLRPNDAIRSAGGATISYWVKKAPQSLKFEILDAKGTVIRTFTNTPPAAPAGGGRAGGGGAGGFGGGGRGGGGGGALASTAPGFDSVTWDLRYPGGVSFPGMVLWGGSVNTGPAAAPGTYQVRMTVDGRTQTQPLLVKRHPQHEATDADLVEQFNLASQALEKASEANRAVIQIRAIKDQVKDRLSKNSDAKLAAAGARLTKDLSVVEEEIYQVRNQSSQDPLNFPIKLNNRLATLYSVVSDGDGKPIGNAPAIFKDLVAELKVQTSRLTEVLTTDLAAFNVETKRLGLEPVSEK